MSEIVSTINTGREGGYNNTMASDDTLRCDNGRFDSLLRYCPSKRCLYHDTNPQQSDNRFGFVRIIGDEKGGIDFLIILPLLVFLVFISVDFFTLFANYQIAKHVSYYYLERVRVEGQLTTTDEAAMINAYQSAKMTVDNISCKNGLNNARQSTGGTAVIKDPSSADNSRINLSITVKPENRPLISAAVIGASPMGDNYRIKVGGDVLSDKV